MYRFKFKVDEMQYVISCSGSWNRRKTSTEKLMKFRENNAGFSALANGRLRRQHPEKMSEGYSRTRNYKLLCAAKIALKKKTKQNPPIFLKVETIFKKQNKK